MGKWHPGWRHTAPPTSFRHTSPYLHDLIVRDDRCAGKLSVECRELQAVVVGYDEREAYLASDGKGRKMLPAFGAERTEMLEKAIDRMTSVLPEVRYFTLTTGRSALFLLPHMSHGGARRTERCAVRVAEKEAVSEEVMRYINRLSDYLYVLGRYICHSIGVGGDRVGCRRGRPI